MGRFKTRRKSRALTLATGVHGIAPRRFQHGLRPGLHQRSWFPIRTAGSIFATGGAASFVGAAFSVRAADKLGVQRAIVLGLAGMSVGNGLATFAHRSGPVSIALLVNS
jgi:MFS family permease